jgi:hypothetical protein
MAFEMVEETVENGPHRVAHARTLRRNVQTAHVEPQPLLGRVVVVAGDDPELADVAALAMHHGAAVAVVSTALDDTTTATVRFRADPKDGVVWERLAMDIEQHLGPVDGVATDESSYAVVAGVFAGDLARRGHGQVIAVRGTDAVPDVVTRLCDTPPAAPSPPAAASPDP